MLFRYFLAPLDKDFRKAKIKKGPAATVSYYGESFSLLQERPRQIRLSKLSNSGENFWASLNHHAHDFIRVGTWCVGGIESKPDTLDVLLYNEVIHKHCD